MRCTFEQNKDFGQLTFSTLLHCKKLLSVAFWYVRSQQYGDTFNTYHKLYNNWVRCVCELSFCRKWMTHYNLIPVSIPAFNKWNLTNILWMLQASRRKTISFYPGLQFPVLLASIQDKSSATLLSKRMLYVACVANSTGLFTNPLTASPLRYQNKSTRAKSRQLRRLCCMQPLSDVTS